MTEDSKEGGGEEQEETQLQPLLCYFQEVSCICIILSCVGEREDLKIYILVILHIYLE